MGCSTCKEKKDIKKELTGSTGDVSKGVVWFVVIWSLFALYGIYSFVIKFI